MISKTNEIAIECRRIGATSDRIRLETTESGYTVVAKLWERGTRVLLSFEGSTPAVKLEALLARDALRVAVDALRDD